MDATYKDTITAQLEGNPFIDYEIKEGILNIIGRFSENDLKNMTKEDKNRFFYKSKFADVKNKIKEEMPTGLKKSLQAQVNREARQGKESSNKFVAEAFETTYTRGGHKYINGKRIY